MNLIEEAARRLQQLEKAGIHVPEKSEPEGRAADARIARAHIRPTEGKRIEPFLPAEPAVGANVRKIDFARLQARGFINPSVRDSKLLHDFRVIKRPLIQHALGKSGVTTPNRNLIMVTSALPNEGKTFVALNLAISMAM